jgi:hypothetical protein
MSPFISSPYASWRGAARRDLYGRMYSQAWSGRYPSWWFLFQYLVCSGLERALSFLVVPAIGLISMPARIAGSAGNYTAMAQGLRVLFHSYASSYCGVSVANYTAMVTQGLRVLCSAYTAQYLHLDAGPYCGVGW